MLLLQVVATYLLVTATSAFRTGCKVRVNGDLPNPQPIILNADTKQAFHYPDHDDIITVFSADTLNLQCLGKNNTFMFRKVGGEDDWLQEVEATCVNDDKFAVQGLHYSFSQLVCRDHSKNEAIKTGTCLDDQYTAIDIGFRVKGGEFLPIMNICFDEKNKDAIYSQYTLVPNIRGYQSQFPRPRFSPSTFYGGIDINYAFIRRNQRKTISKILGSDKLGSDYVANSGDYYLARGHLTAKADFVFGVQHLATFYYMNTAPQWQTFNGGNWQLLESGLRSYIGERNTTVQVTTGTWGIATLPDASGVEKPLHLFVDENNNTAIRIPKYYWKAVYEPSTKLGVVFIGMNNPYHKTVPEDVFCKDVCLSNYKWISWDRTDQVAGYSFCCEVEDFRQTVDTLPKFEVEGIFV